MKKGWMLSLLLLIPTVLAEVDVFGKVLDFATLSAIDSADKLVGITRILFGILLFTIYFALLTAVSGSGKELKFLTERKHVMIISLILSLISAIFIPSTVLLVSGSGLAMLISVLLVGGPVLGMIYVMWKFPEEDTKKSYIVKLVLSAILLWVVYVMKDSFNGAPLNYVSEDILKYTLMFIDYVIIAVWAMVVYYVIKMFSMNNEDADNQWKERSQNLGAVLRKGMDKSKRQDYIKFLKSFTVKLIKNLDQAEEAIIHDDNKKAAKIFDNSKREIHSNLLRIRRNVKNLFLKEQIKSDKFDLSKLDEHYQDLENKFTEEKKLTELNHPQDKDKIIDKIDKMRVHLGEILTWINNFVNEVDEHYQEKIEKEEQAKRDAEKRKAEEEKKKQEEEKEKEQEKNDHKEELKGFIAYMKELLKIKPSENNLQECNEKIGIIINMFQRKVFPSLNNCGIKVSEITKFRLMYNQFLTQIEAKRDSEGDTVDFFKDYKSILEKLIKELEKII
jgi:hypothetical protein